MSDEQAVDEGLMIAAAALNMAVKNAVIVGALRDGLRYDSREVAEVARAEIRDLATENLKNSERLEQLSEDVQMPGRSEVSSERYNEEDSPALTQRSELHDRLSSELERLSFDEAYLAAVAERARLAAWSEVSAAIEARLDLVPASSDPLYNEKRDARIKELLAVDLKTLQAKTRKQRHRLKRLARQSTAQTSQTS
jgi:hypothetical protein